MPVTSTISRVPTTAAEAWSGLDPIADEADNEAAVAGREASNRMSSGSELMDVDCGLLKGSA
jgi:hypothetical protein